MICNRWDIILVSFPFTDFSQNKKRPALIISPEDYNRGKDVIISFITSNTNIELRESDVIIKEWKKAGLPKPSIIRMELATIDKLIIVKKIGTLQKNDINDFMKNLQNFFSLTK